MLSSPQNVNAHTVMHLEREVFQNAASSQQEMIQRMKLECVKTMVTMSTK